MIIWLQVEGCEIVSSAEFLAFSAGIKHSWGLQEFIKNAPRFQAAYQDEKQVS